MAGVTPERASAPRQAILVVEDVILVRMLVAKHLRESGFMVIEAGGAADALHHLEESDEIGVVFSDVALSEGGDGFSLAEQIHERWPEVRVVLGSGIDDVAARAWRANYPAPILRKPYDLPEVANRLSTMLQELS
ncbi:MAG: response regulator [Reyranella sp.]|nr:MAG: response regulator [Reyranella sp.]